MGPLHFPNCLWVFVVAHLSVMPKICVTSAIIVEVKAVPLSVIIVVGKYACLVMMSMSALATLIDSSSGNPDTGHKNSEN